MDIEETIRKLKAKGYDPSVTPEESKLFLDKAAELENKYNTYAYPDAEPKPRVYTVQRQDVVVRQWEYDIVEEGWGFTSDDPYRDWIAPSG